MSGKERKSVQRIDGTWVNRAENVPYGYCHCGCGGKTNLAPRTVPSRGYVKGEPYKFVRYHGGVRGSVARPLEDMFFPRVDERGDDECWEWQGARLAAGYGQFECNYESKLAHRVAYEFAYGPIPEGLVVRHKCDNPPCCNPAHLETGTYKDNMQDAAKRNRMPYGEDHKDAVLTEQDVREIRELRAQGMTYSALARIYGVSISNIRVVVNRKTWRRVA